MASLGTIDYKGLSGKTYTFNIYDLNSSWNEVSVVYLVTRAFTKENGKLYHSLIYIGQTDNLKERFSNHHKQNCFNIKNANRLCLIVENNEAVRLQIESDLIKGNKAPCND